MKLFIKLIFCVLLVIPLSLEAQTVSGTLFNIPQQKVYLYAYTGLYLETLDSVMMNHDGNIEFNVPLKNGMYMIETEFGNSFDFISDGNKVSFVMPNPEDWKSVRYINSDINTQWLQYQILKNETFKLQEPLKQVLRDYDRKSDFYQQAKNEYNRIQNELYEFTEDLLKNNNYASKLIRVDRPSLINLDDDFKKQREVIIEHFFDNVDFSDTTLIPTNVMTTKVIDFLSVAQNSKQTSQGKTLETILAIDHVLLLSSVSYPMYKFIFQYLLEGFNQFKLYDYVDYMTRLPYVEDMNISELYYQELTKIVEENSRIRIGDKVPDIKAVTLDGEDFNLYNIKNDYTIVFFWSFSCEHCRDFIDELTPFLKTNPDYSLVSVSVKGKPKEIKRLIRKKKLNGYFICDGLEWKSPVVEAYSVSSTPSIFVLDKNKNLLLKPFGIDELIYFNNTK